MIGGAGPVRLEVTAPRRVETGRPVTFVLRATNTGSDSVTLYLRGREIAFDLIVSRADAPQTPVVWQRLRGATIPAIVQVRQLGAGESLVLEHRWDQRGDDGNPVGPGAYLVRGLLLTDDPEPMRSSEVPFEITDR